MIRICSWNMAHRTDAWHHLVQAQYDVALLQEATEPPEDLAPRLRHSGREWKIPGEYHGRRWRSAIVALSPDVAIEWYPTAAYADAKAGDVPVSRVGAIEFASVTRGDHEPVVLASLYGIWEKPCPPSSWIFADSSVHRLVSDLCYFIGSEGRHRIIAAGDLNILHGYGEYGNRYWSSRYSTVFDRMAAIGLPFIGPQQPHGEPPNPWPDELPLESGDVPTFRTTRADPASASRQLDFVFASTQIRRLVTVTAKNGADDWGPSDHCIIEINLDL